MSRCVVVMGMHRSGTSALAGALTRLGWDPGSSADLLPPAEDNVKGFFENKNLVEINDRLLGEIIRSLPVFDGRTLNLGEMGFKGEWIFGAWALAVLPHDLRFSNRLLRAMEDFIEGLSMEIARGKRVLLKDPRFSLTYKWWKEFLPEHKIIVSVRRPESVICSLVKRNGMSPVLASFLWLLYNRSWLNGVINNNFKLVVCEDLVENPRGVLEAIGFFLDGGDVDLQAMDRAVEFIEPELFSAACKSDLPTGIYSGVDKVYGMLVKERCGDAFLEIESILNKVLEWVSWSDILCMARLQVESENVKDLRLQLQRIENHPLFGPAIHLWRKIVNPDYDVFKGIC